jgi:hypothetical protein
MEMSDEEEENEEGGEESPLAVSTKESVHVLLASLVILHFKHLFFFLFPIVAHSAQPSV